MMHHWRRFVSIPVTVIGLSLAGCGSGGGSDSASPPIQAVSENRIDVTVAGLPPGTNAAVSLSDSIGRVVATLTASGSVVVAGPGSFTVSANPVVATSLTYLAAVTPAAVTVPAPPSTNAVSVIYAAAPPLKLRFEAVAKGLDAPTFLAAPPGSTDLYVVELPGRIRKLVNGVPQAPVVDISARVGAGGERGMLSLAFDPGFAANGYVYVCFTETSGDIAVERFTLPVPGNGAPSSGVEATALRVITIPHRSFANHNGGQLQFGPDGYLYIGTGDGGSGGDPNDRAQNLNDPLGKILRLDVNAPAPYIPSSNPFATRAGARGEVWAYGLRNPWRFSFDRETGDLWIGDVGQDRYEEVDLQPRASIGGENYGWRRMEGFHCFNPSTNCSDPAIVRPIIEYSHDDGSCAIVGGYRYRGLRMPSMRGAYFYGDYCTGKIWTATPNAAGTWTPKLLVDTPMSISAFGEDINGELYVLDLNGSVSAFSEKTNPRRRAAGH